MDQLTIAQILGSYGEFIGAIAVVATLVYLAIQVRHSREATEVNNRLLRSQAHYNALQAAQKPFELLIQSESVAGILVKCDQAPYDIDESDWRRCVNYYFMQANGWEYLYYQNLDNAIPPELWVGGDGYFSNEARTNVGWMRFWQETAMGFGEPFRSYVQEHVDKNPNAKA